MSEVEPLDEQTRDWIRDGVIDASTRARTVFFGLMVLCLFSLVTSGGLAHARRLAHATSNNLSYSNSLRIRAEARLDEALAEPGDPEELARRTEALRRAEVREARAWDLAQQHSLSVGDTDASVPIFGVSLGATELFLILPLLILVLYVYLRSLLRMIARGLVALQGEIQPLPSSLRPLVTSPWLGTHDRDASLRARLSAWLALDMVVPVALMGLGVLLFRAFPFEARDVAPLEPIHWVAWVLYAISTLVVVGLASLATWARWRRR